DSGSGTLIGYGDASYTFNTGTVFSGAGVNRITGGNVNLDGSINSANLEYAGGNLYGTFSLIGTLLWTSGTIISNGTITISDGSTLTIAGGVDKDIVGKTIENFGTVAWTGGRLRTGSATQLINHSRWEIQSDLIVFNSDFGGTMSTFTNDGTFRKSNSTGTTYVDIHFVNNGLIDVQSGTLFFRSSTESFAGTFNSAAGTLIGYRNATSFNNDTVLSGAGVNRITGGGVNLAGDIHSANLEYSRGNLTGTFTLIGSLLWNDGTMVNPGTITIANGSTLTIAGNVDKDIVGMTLENFGTVVWAGGRIRTGSGTQLLNHGLWDVQVDQLIFNSDFGGAMSNLINTGTLRKSVGTGTTNVAILFNNPGTVDVRAGTLLLSGPFSNFADGNTLDGGTWIVAGRLMWSGAQVATNLAAIVLDGPTSIITDLSGGNAVDPFLVQNGSGAVLEFRNGRNFSTVGSLTNLGTLHIGPTSVLHVLGTLSLGTSSRFLSEINGLVGGNGIGLLDVIGPVTLHGVLAVSVANGFLPAVGDILTVMHFTGTSTGSFDSFEGLVQPSGVFFGAQLLPNSEILTTNRAPLAVAGISPSGLIGQQIAFVDVTFNQAIDPVTFSATDVVISGPLGTIPVSSIAFVSGNIWRINVAALTTDGGYQARIGPDILDVRGIPMNQDLDGFPGESVDDVFTGTLTLDRAPPVVDSTTITPNLIQVHFVDAGGLDAATITDISNYILTGSGGDISNRIHSITFTPDSTGGTAFLTLQPSLGPDTYSLTVRSSGIHDLTGHNLGGGTDVVTQSVVTPIPMDAPSGLVGWWRAEDNTTDSAGTNDGTLRNGAGFTSGLAGRAFAFDGIDDYVELPANPAILGLTHGTLELWARVLTLGTNQVHLFTVSDSGPSGFNSDSWGLDYRSSGAIEVFLINSGQIVTAAFTPANTVTDSNFHHYAVIADGVNPIEVYVDGVLQTLTAPFSTTNDRFFGHATRADTMIIGALRRDAVFAEGAKVIDEVSIYNRALSATEIQNIVAAGGAGKREFENTGGSEASDIRNGLVDGLQNLFTQLPNWLSLFNLDQFISPSTGLPLFQLPVVSPQLSSLFGLASKIGSVGVPSIPNVTGMGNLINTLRAAGFDVLSIDGGLGDVPASAAGERIRVRLPLQLANLTRSGTSGS
ncbi:MAG TPA: LamG-like jellyroll fold domain-containing protein, partial [Terriglobia bacterium]|nr:LamG-like jellyroll fold domain-containing protein [Terriglobia bacterium]